MIRTVPPTRGFWTQLLVVPRHRQIELFLICQLSSQTRQLLTLWNIPSRMYVIQIPSDCCKLLFTPVATRKETRTTHSYLHTASSPPGR